MPMRPRFCMDITSIPIDAVVAKSTVALAVTWTVVRSGRDVVGFGWI